MASKSPKNFLVGEKNIGQLLKVPNSPQTKSYWKNKILFLKTLDVKPITLALGN